MQIADRGADIVRITVQGKREADACFEIKNTLVQKKYVYISTVRNLYFHLIYLIQIWHLQLEHTYHIHFAQSVSLGIFECLHILIFFNMKEFE